MKALSKPTSSALPKIAKSRLSPVSTSSLQLVLQKMSRASKAFLRTTAGYTNNGFLAITHNGFALLGLALALVTLLVLVRPELRQSAEQKLLSWLQVRQNVTGVASLNTTGNTTGNAANPVSSFFTSSSEPRADAQIVAIDDLDASERATATDPADLPKQQAAVAFWLSKKYRVAPEPLSALVAEAYAVGAKAKLDPTLILAIMAIESGFNPFAQSPVGAQGLMQVMTKIHSDKYENFGGTLAAFDPVTNLKVGVKVLQESIARAGSVQGGLKHYVGAANMEGDGGYAGKVLAEYARLHQVATGRPAPIQLSNLSPLPAQRLDKSGQTLDAMPTNLPASTATDSLSSIVPVNSMDQHKPRDMKDARDKDSEKIALSTQTASFLIH